MARVDEQKFDDEIQKLLEGRKYTQAEIDAKIKFIQETYGITDIVRVCSYGRVSTTHTEQESSLYNQNKRFHTYCNKKEEDGWVLVEEVYDRKSGTVLSERKKMLYIIEKAKAGYFDILLFKDSKRFSRNTEDFLSLIEELKRLKIYVVFINEGVNSKTATREQLTMLGMMSESHSNGLHLSVTSAMKIKMETGVRMPPNTFGYDKPTVRDSNVFSINEAEAELIRELFTRLRNLEGFASICEDWRARGIKTKTGGEMSKEALKRYARNKKYIGIFEMGKDTRSDVRAKRQKTDPSEWKVKYDERARIVEDSLFYEVQTILDARSSKVKESIVNKEKLKTTRNRMLSGVIKCGVCGRGFQRQVGGSKGRPYGYFGCQTAKDSKKHSSNIECTNTRNVRQDELIHCLGLYLKELLENKEDLKKLVRERVKAIIAEEQKTTGDDIELLTEIDKAKVRLERAKELFIEGEISKAEYNEYKSNLKALESRQTKSTYNMLKDYDVEKIVETFCNNLEKCIEMGLDEDKIDGFLFNSLFDEIIVYPDRIEVNFKLLGNSGLVDINRGGCTLNNDYKIDANGLINWAFIRKDCLRKKDENRRMYRLSGIFGRIGAEYVDDVNIFI